MPSGVKKVLHQLLSLMRGLHKPPIHQLGRIILGFMLLSETAVSALWIYAFSGLGEGYALMAIFPYTYIVLSYTTLLVFYHFRLMQYFTFTQLTMLLVMPFFMQWAMGGFEASSGMAIWAVMAPIGALMIMGTRQSSGWFLLYFLLLTFSWLMNDVFASYALPIPQHIKSLLFLVNIGGASILLYLLMRFFEVQRDSIMQALDDKNHQLELEQGRSERLLLNIMPKSVVDRLKQGESKIADSYDAATIMFADLVDFTRISDGMQPDALVDLLNLVFSRFDQLTEKYGVEKIKTIGDAYMVVSGVPEPRPDHAEVIAHLAIDMQQALMELSVSTGKMLMMRIGINSGPVVAGVIGSAKFSYDLWGDTVNMASRMEHYGLSNVIQVTESTYHLIKDKFRFEKREPINVKGKGRVQTYLLLGRIGPAGIVSRQALETSRENPT
ncbi:MAG: adenylate/guanylate cyclase domain-containing protein [Methylophilaceae bacterium]|nr:adenylate/guanylate cyclase domain-containing protein [Methylophilaceae bacterium]